MSSSAPDQPSSPSDTYKIDSLLNALSQGPAPGQALEKWANPVAMWVMICNVQAVKGPIVEAFGGILNKAACALPGHAWWWLCEQYLGKQSVYGAAANKRSCQMWGGAAHHRVSQAGILEADIAAGHALIMGRALTAAPTSDLLPLLTLANHPTPTPAMRSAWWVMATGNSPRQAAPLLAILMPHMSDPVAALETAICKRHTAWAKPHVAMLPPHGRSMLGPACLHNESVPLLKMVEDHVPSSVWANEMLVKSLQNEESPNNQQVHDRLKKYWDCAQTTSATWKKMGTSTRTQHVAIMAPLLTPAARLHPMIHEIGVTFGHWNNRDAADKLTILLPHATQHELLRAISPTKKLHPTFITMMWDALDTPHRRRAAENFPSLCKDPAISAWVLTDQSATGQPTRPFKM